MSHTIRLRGHWEQSPADGIVRWVRRFGRPTGGAAVALRVVAATFPCRVRVNDGIVHDVSEATVPIRLDSLLPRNVIVVESASEPEVLLELRDPA